MDDSDLDLFDALFSSEDERITYSSSSSSCSSSSESDRNSDGDDDILMAEEILIRGRSRPRRLRPKIHNYIDVVHEYTDDEVNFF